MSFEDLLRRKLGPMRDLVARPLRREARPRDPGALYYRRAVGLEVRVRPEETWAEMEVRRCDSAGRAPERLSSKRARALLGMSSWTHAKDLAAGEGLSPKELWRWVEHDLLFFADHDPGRALQGAPGALDVPGVKIARRGSVWPTQAVETALQIAPMPFMPRGRDLEGAELVGVRLASLERGVEVLGASITGGPHTGGVLRRLLPLLDGRRTQEELLAAFPGQRTDAEKMLVLLDTLTALESRSGAPEPASALEHPTKPQVTWLGHACVLVQSVSASVLVDPLFFSASDPPEPSLDSPKFDPRALPRLDAVLITHGDNDHLNANSLAMLAASTPVYVPRAPHPCPPYQVDMRGVLRVLGFSRVSEIDPWQTFEVGDLAITACPFEGESWGLDLAKVTYLVEGPGLSVFLAADSARMDETYAAIRRRGRAIDLAFMGVSGNAEAHVMPPGFGYGNFYEPWVPAPERNAWIQHSAGPEDAVRSLEILRPRFAFGYAAGGAGYIRTEYSDPGSHEELARRLGEAQSEGPLETRAVSLPIGTPIPLAELSALAPHGRPLVPGGNS